VRKSFKPQDSSFHNRDWNPVRTGYVYCSVGSAYLLSKLNGDG